MSKEIETLYYRLILSFICFFETQKSSLEKLCVTSFAELDSGDWWDLLENDLSTFHTKRSSEYYTSIDFISYKLLFVFKYKEIKFTSKNEVLLSQRPRPNFYLNSAKSAFKLVSKQANFQISSKQTDINSSSTTTTTTTITNNNTISTANIQSNSTSVNFSL